LASVLAEPDRSSRRILRLLIIRRWNGYGAETLA
jgi:hypothetical protein